MFSIVGKRQLSDSVFELSVRAPRIARKARAGQFLIVRVNQSGERVPFTVSDWSSEEGWVRFIFMRVGKTTHLLSHLCVGDSIADVVGPLGVPTRVEDMGRVAVVCGGVGAAAAYPIARAMVAGGSEVTVVAGARSEELLIMREKFEQLALSGLVIVTDDGSVGEKGLVTTPLRRMCEAGGLDHVMAIGPAIMMKHCAATAKEYGVRCTVSLNPIMVDGTGMCGACRVTVGGKVRFGCVDGPDFDGWEVDFEELMSRQRIYADDEREADVEYSARCSCHL